MTKTIAEAYLTTTMIPCQDLPPELRKAPMQKVREWLTAQAYPAGAVNGK